MSKKLKNQKHFIIKISRNIIILFWCLVLATSLYIFHDQITQTLNSLDWHLLKDYLALIFSWPTAVVIIGLVFMNRFHSAIRGFLTNANYVKAGMFEAGVQSSENGSTSTIDEQVRENLERNGLTLTDEQVAQLEVNFQNLVEDNNRKTVNIQDKDNMIEWLTERTVQFEFKYLNLHLVPRTKIALIGLLANDKKLVDFLNDVFIDNEAVDASHERQAVLQALQENELIEVKSGNVSITDKGRRFLEFIGPARRD